MIRNPFVLNELQSIKIPYVCTTNFRNPMKIMLNNTLEILDDSKSWTVRDILELKKFSFKLLVVKINGKLIPKTDYDIASVNDGDDVMILHLMSGG